MATNLTRLGRVMPQRATNIVDYVQPAWDMPEVYNFNPAIERVNEQNLNAFRKPQVNASPAVINTNEWIGWLVMPATQEQERQLRIEEARTKIVDFLWVMIKAWQLSTDWGKTTARTLIDLYNKIR